MSMLIVEFQKDHADIASMLEGVKKHGFTTKEGKEILESVKVKLIAHLRKEDTHLYPALRKAAETDESLKQMLSFFAKDTEEISKGIMRFFEKYGVSSITDSKEFAKDFGWVCATLQSRIRKEESNLYRAYSKLGV